MNRRWKSLTFIEAMVPISRESIPWGVIDPSCSACSSRSSPNASLERAEQIAVQCKLSWVRPKAGRKGWVVGVDYGIKIQFCKCVVPDALKDRSGIVTVLEVPVQAEIGAEIMTNMPRPV